VTYVPFKGISGRFKGLLRLYSMAKQIDARVYHCNEVDSWVVGVLLRLIAGRICVFDAHEHYPEEFTEVRISPWAQPIVRNGLALFMRMLTWFTHRVVVAKTSLLDEFSYMPESNLVTVQNFVPINNLPNPQHREGDGNLNIVHLGLFNRVRGWPQLLEGMIRARCQNTKLVVIGTINDGSEEKFIATVDQLGLQDRVEYQAWLPYEQAMERLKAADVGVVCFQPGFFNHVHAMPHKLFDYMSAELAVMVPDYAVEIREIINDSRCGMLIDSANPDDIARGIDIFCDDFQAVRAYGRNGRQAVLDRYNWETESKVLVDLYRDLELI